MVSAFYVKKKKKLYYNIKFVFLVVVVFNSFTATGRFLWLSVFSLFWSILQKFRGFKLICKHYFIHKESKKKS